MHLDGCTQAHTHRQRYCWCKISSCNHAIVLLQLGAVCLAQAHTAAASHLRGDDDIPSCRQPQGCACNTAQQADVQSRPRCRERSGTAGKRFHTHLAQPIFRATLLQQLGNPAQACHAQAASLRSIASAVAVPDAVHAPARSPHGRSSPWRDELALRSTDKFCGVDFGHRVPCWWTGFALISP